MNIVQAALADAPKSLAANLGAKWFITFINNETRYGQITHVEGDTYFLDGKLPWYFNANHVVYMYPDMTNQ